jgi:hypothetical protein
MKPDNILDYVISLEGLSKEYGEIHKQVWNKSNLFWGQKNKSKNDYEKQADKMLDISSKLMGFQEEFSLIKDQFDNNFADLFDSILKNTFIATSVLNQYLTAKNYVENENGPLYTKAMVDRLFDEYFYSYKEYVRSAKAFEKYMSKK